LGDLNRLSQEHKGRNRCFRGVREGRDNPITSAHTERKRGRYNGVGKIGAEEEGTRAGGEEESGGRMCGKRTRGRGESDS